MKRLIIIMISFSAIVASCKDDSLKDVDEDTNLDLKGEWYVSGSSYSIVRNDSASFNYDDYIVGYQEFDFQPIKNGDKLYSLIYKFRDLPIRDGEGEIDHFDRILAGNYTAEELLMEDIPHFTWKINGNQINSTLQYPNVDYPMQDNLQIAKITKWSSNQFVLVTNYSRFPLSDGEYDKTGNNYYFTFKRIK